ncbi:hypothetical protein [Microbacterium xylanilyticum]
MNGSDTATTALKVKEALVAAARAVSDPDVVLVAQGIPTIGRDKTQIVAFLGVELQQQPATLSTNRSRDEDISVDGVVSVQMAGYDDDKAVEDAAWDILRSIERQVRRTDPTLGGVALWCFLTSARSFGYTTADQLAQGRLCEIEFTFTARVRITG